MQAFQLQENNQTSFNNITMPIAKNDEVLVKVFGSSVNPVDWKIATGMLSQLVQQPLPLTLGWDLVGEVIETGNQSKDFFVGERVFAMKEIGSQGALSEYCVVKRTHLARVPKSVSNQHAGVVPMAMLTAWQALIGAGNIHRNKRVFIQAGAGGVGHMAIQLAKVMEAEVIVSTSTKNVQFVRALGADQILDYEKQDVYQWLEQNPVDVVLESLHGEDQIKCVSVLKPKGRLISISGLQQQTINAAKDAGITAEFVFVQPNGNQLEQAAELLETGRIMPHISASIPRSDIARGYQLSQTGKVRGKLFIDFSDNDLS